jgi:hypothetical protein
VLPFVDTHGPNSEGAEKGYELQQVNGGHAAILGEVSMAFHAKAHPKRLLTVWGLHISLHQSAVRGRRSPEPFGGRDSTSSDTHPNTTAVGYPWATVPDANAHWNCG